MKIIINKPEIFRKEISPSIFTWKDVEHCLNCLPSFLNPTDPASAGYIQLINHITGKKDDPRIPFKVYDWCDATLIVSYIFERIKLGDSFIINNLSRYNKDINDICKSLEEMTGSSSDAHLYGGLHSHSKSFSMHRDNPHNLIIQFEGSCSWKVWQDNVLVIDDILYPGDVIYVPASYYHEAIPTGRRISISFPFGNPLNIKIQDRNWYKLT